MKKFGLGLILFCSTAWAGWVPGQDAEVVLEWDNTSLEVKADGTYIQTDERKFTAKNERGRSRLALEAVRFLPELSKLEVLEAVSITNGVETPVDLKTIQERAAPGPAEGLTGVKELVIPFTNLQVGSSIKYKLKTTAKKPLYPGVFAMHFIYGAQFPEMGGTVKIRSEKRLEYSARDVEKALKIETAVDGNFHLLTITQLKPVSRVLKDEKIPIFPPSAFPQVQVSSLRNWQEFADLVTEKYEERLREELPVVFKTIVEKAALKKDLYEKIDTVTSELSSLMTYSGNWTTAEKMFYPKSQNEIAASKTGDCKDFATATVAMLRALGIKSSVALLSRRNPYDPSQLLQSTPLTPGLAIPSLFNHAVVRVEGPDKKIFWVDPTNLVSHSRLLRPDIAGSVSLNISKRSEVLEKLPVVGAEDSLMKVEKVLRVAGDGKGESEGTLSVSGLYAIDLIETSFRDGAKKANEVVAQVYGALLENGGDQVQANYKSRIAAPLEAKVTTSGERNYVEKEGKAFLVVPFPAVLQVYIHGQAQGRVTDFYSNPQGKYESRTQVEGQDFADTESLGCYAVSPWVDIERILLKNEKGFEVRDKVVFKKDLIPAADINGEDYGFSMGDLQTCLKAQTVQVHKLDSGETLPQRLRRFTLAEIRRLEDLSGPGSLLRAQEVKMIADQLLAANPKDLEARMAKIKAQRRLGYRYGEVTAAAYLAVAERDLEEVLKENPEHLGALFQKIYNMIDLEKMDVAKDTFTKAYYAAKENKTYELYKAGGFLSERLQKYEVAEGSYLKALALASTDGQRAETLKKLGDLHRQQSRLSQAEEYYYKALKYDPENSWLLNDLLLIALNKKDFDGGIEIGERMLKLADFGVGRANLAVAYGSKALQILQSPSQDVTRFERARDLAQKGMKWDETSVECLLALGSSFYETALLKKDAGLMKRSLDLSIKALAYAKDPGIRMQAVEMVNKVTTAKSQWAAGSPRVPAAAGPSGDPVSSAPSSRPD